MDIFTKGVVFGILASIATAVGIMFVAFVVDGVRISEIDKEVKISIRTADELDHNDISTIVKMFDSSECNVKKYNYDRHKSSITLTKYKTTKKETK